jgi:hypothetical protein
VQRRGVELATLEDELQQRRERVIARLGETAEAASRA